MVLKENSYERNKKKLKLTALEQFKNGMSDETKQKISNANKGRILSTEHKKKLSLSKLGKTTWSKGTYWISSDVYKKSIMIKPDDIQDYVDLGWYRGRKYA